MAETKKIPERAELAQQDKWAIEDIYATDELWEADLEKARGYIPKIAADQRQSEAPFSLA